MINDPPRTGRALPGARPLLLPGLGCGPPGSDDSHPSASRPSASAHFGADPATVPRGERLVERLLVLALDGATWELATPLIEEGRLPNLARLSAEGVHAELTTLEPTVSPAIWTTIATGFLPQRHGILGFEGVPGKSMKTLPNARMRRVKTYWNILDDLGVRTGTLGWWATWPADDLIEGSWLVSDRVPYTRMEAAVLRATLSPRDTEPPELLDSVASLVERPNDITPQVLRAFLNLEGAEAQELVLGAEYRMGSYLPEFKFVHQSDRSTWKMALHLLEQRPVDVLSIYFTGIDTVSHLYWHFTFPGDFPRHRISGKDVERYGQVIPRYYELVDGYLGELLSAMGENTTVLVVSDHGFGGTGDLPWSGGHGRLTPGAPIAPRGILILSGPGIASGGKRLPRAHVLDVAPTILHLVGLPAAEDMLGRVLIEALAPGSAELPRVESYENIGRLRIVEDIPVDPVGDSERLERLKALGYIE